MNWETLNFMNWKQSHRLTAALSPVEYHFYLSSLADGMDAGFFKDAVTRALMKVDVEELQKDFERENINE